MSGGQLRDEAADDSARFVPLKSPPLEAENLGGGGVADVVNGVISLFMLDFINDNKVRKRQKAQPREHETLADDKRLLLLKSLKWMSVEMLKIALDKISVRRNVK
nr:hypothetical protein BgiMline_012185 [Biomphalaria glabrata]